MYFGKLGNQFIFALPGNPVSVFSCYHQYVKLFIKGCLGRRNFEQDRAFAVSLSGITKKNKEQTQFLKDFYSEGKVSVLGAQESDKMNSAVFSNCLLEFPENKSEISVGETVKIWKI